ncbi:thiamine pyrophosphate-dependent dehydrogenase E1 component subunit alpha [Halobium palmae]|uniref:Thiamine pyrophosphate-dependent dehydrogenase E1 component subunit alpha n=1 Tax=Halobium palmae TaxID=1776492 RepID=A0ABD5RWH6_9EURY
MQKSDDERREILEYLSLTRWFEEKCLEVYESGGIPELPHLSLGQEAVGVASTCALEEDDWVLPSLRTRAPILMRVPLEMVTAGMFGTRSGPSEGRTTQHHMGSAAAGIMGTTGMVGSHLNVGAGAALGSMILGDDRVSIVFFGDGGAQRAELHSALNFATINDLPVIFMIENNGMTEEMPLEKLVDVDDLEEFGSQGLPTEVVDGQDADLVYDATAEAAERARAGDGPTLIEAKTYRYRPHAEVMEEARDESEIEEWKERDPVHIYRDRLLEDGVVDEEDLEAMDERLKSEIDEAFEFVENDELPDEEVLYRVYKDTDIDHTRGVVR